MYRFLIVALIILPLGPLYAAPTYEPGNSVSTQSATSSFSSNYVGTYYSILDKNNPTPSLVTNVLLLNYNFHKSYIFGLVLGANLFPTQFERSQIYNPAIRIGDLELIKTSSFQLSEDIRFVFPVNSEAQKQQLRFAVQTTPVINFRAPGSRFWLFSFNRFRYHFYDQTGLGRKSIYFSRTHLNYDINSTLTASWVTVLQLFQNNAANAGFEADRFRAGPGVRVTPMKNLTLSPYITWSVLSPRLNDVAIFMVATGKIF